MLDLVCAVNVCMLDVSGHICCYALMIHNRSGAMRTCDVPASVTITKAHNCPRSMFGQARADWLLVVLTHVLMPVLSCVDEGRGEVKDCGLWYLLCSSCSPDCHSLVCHVHAR